MFNELLNDIYYKQLNFSGVNELYRKAKLINPNIKLSDVSQFLKNQNVQQQTTIPNIKKKEFLPIYSESHNSYQIDLTFLKEYKAQNNNYYVLFTAINVNSRYVYVYYSKSKNSDDIIEMLNKFKKDVKEIDTISGDLGSEFTSNKATDWFKNNNIKTFFYKSDSHKLGLINRFHRTLKEKLLKYFLVSKSVRWIDVIDKIVENYNNSVNTTTGFTPKEASIGFIQTLLINKAKEKTQIIKSKEKVINVGDKCRLKTNKKIFEKTATKYGSEIYTITKVNLNTVSIEDDEGNIKNVKKSNILVIKANESPPSNTNIINKIKSKNKINRTIKKLGVEPINIIQDKRKRNLKIPNIRE